MKPKLIFLDIDGTLTLPGANEVPESALTAIRKAQENGHQIFLCSGRNLGMLKPLMRYHFAGAVSSSGGVVTVGEKLLYDCPMEQDDFELAMRLLGESGVYRGPEAKEGAWCDAGMGEFLVRQTGNSELLRWRKAIEIDLNMRPLSEYDGRSVYKIVFMCEREEQLEPVRKALGEKYHILIQNSKPYTTCVNGELNNRKFSKGTGIQLVAKELGFDLADTIGFGDSMNDLEMMETVGYSVCMGNGSDSLKEICDYVCPPIEEDGLARAFETLGLA